MTRAAVIDWTNLDGDGRRRAAELLRPQIVHRTVDTSSFAREHRRAFIEVLIMALQLELERIDEAPPNNQPRTEEPN